MPLTYKDAGVDIEAGNALVDRIRPLAAETRRPGTVSEIGGFAGLFDLKKAGFSDPILVSTTDGVGTKLRVAIESNDVSGIGIDLVAMCVNDLICHGAVPLFFLDYLAMGKVEPDLAAKIIKGIATACRTAGCALIGGETAEMPGLYRDGDFDLAGFALGAAERHQLLPRDVHDDDVLLGFPSSGLHSNGFSLVRQVVADSRLSWFDAPPVSDQQFTRQKDPIVRSGTRTDPDLRRRRRRSDLDRQSQGTRAHHRGRTNGKYHAHPAGRTGRKNRFGFMELPGNFQVD